MSDPSTWRPAQSAERTTTAAMDEATALQWAIDNDYMRVALSTPIIKVGPTEYSCRCKLPGCRYLDFRVDAASGRYECAGCEREGDALDYQMAVGGAATRAEAAAALTTRRDEGFAMQADPEQWRELAESQAEFAAIVRGSEPLERGIDLASHASLVRADLMPGLAYRGELVSLVGASGSGKTSYAADFCARVIDGEPFLGQEKHRPTGGARVLWINYDRPSDAVIGTLMRFGLHKKADRDFTLLTRLESKYKLDLEQNGDQLVDEIRRRGPSLVVIDSARGCRSQGTSEQSSDDVGLLLQNLQKVVERTGATIVLLIHTGHDPTRERGSKAWRDAVDRSYLLRAAVGGSNLSDLKQTDRETDTTMLRLRWQGPDDDTRHILIDGGEVPSVRDWPSEIVSHLVDNGPANMGAIHKAFGKKKSELSTIIKGMAEPGGLLVKLGSKYGVVGVHDSA